MRALGRVMLVALAGCGRVAFDLIPPDARPDSTELDGAPLGPWGTVMPLSQLNTANAETDPALTGDLLEMYFDSDIGGTGTDIFVTKRNSTSDPWGTATLVTELNTTAFDGAPGITPDGLTMYITSARPGGLGTLDIWRSQRADPQSPWDAPVFVPELSTAEDDSNPQPSSDDLHLWMSSKRGGLAERQLYVSSRSSTVDAWSTPVPITELNDSPTKSTEASWADEGFDIYFASNRMGTLGANDLWYATRTSLSDPFGAPMRLDELDTTSGDQDPWVSPDRRMIVFMSRRDGNPDLFYATR